jgi:hypothetical protein
LGKFGARNRGGGERGEFGGVDRLWGGHAQRVL